MSTRACRVGAIFGALAATFLLLAGGCADEPAPLAPVTGTCIVQGAIIAPRTIRTNDSIRFQRVDGTELYLRVMPDAEGRYRAELPAGDYVVAAYVGPLQCFATHDGGVANSWDTPDTLRLESGAGPRQIDFRLGIVDLTSENLAGIDGWTVRATLVPTQADFGFMYSGISVEDAVENGRVHLEVGPAVPGTYVIEVALRRDWSQEGEDFWLPGVLAVSAAAQYRVSADSLTVVETSWPVPARLTGTIAGAWMNLGVNAPLVIAVNADSVRVAGPFRVDELGRFVLPFLRPEPVRLVITEGESQIWVGGPVYDEATVFNLEPGMTVSGIEEAISTVMVRTTLAQYDSMSNSARLELRDPSSRALVVSRYFYFNEIFGLSCLPPGQYLARITSSSSSRSWRNQWYDRATTPESASLITIPPNGAAIALDILLERGGVISGTASMNRPSGSWAYVVVTRDDSDALLLTQYVGRLESATGFSMGGLEDGRYKVALSAREYTGGEQGEWIEEYSWYPGTSDWAAAGVIEISGASTVSDIVLTLP